MQLFQNITDPAEIQEFKQWARDNYEPLTPIDGTWHPIVQAECARINTDTNLSADLDIACQS